MPPLHRPRHERLAEMVADGSTYTAACEALGFSRNPGGPDGHGLRTQIMTRVDEIQAERAAAVMTGARQAVSKALATREELWGRIEDLIGKAMEKEEFPVALRGMELLGKDIGMFVNRIQSSQDLTITQLQDDSTVRDELEDIFGAPRRSSANEGGSGGVVPGSDPGREETRH